MSISVNGEILKDFEGNIAELLKSRNLSSDKVAVEYNGKIISRDSFNSIHLNDGDTLEIVHFVGGG